MVKLFSKPVIDRPHPINNEGGQGTQKIYRFPNGYGASVVRFKLRLGGIYGSYTDNDDEWELGVIQFTGKGDTNYKLTSDTPITDDVIGHLTEDEVEETLQRIKKLPPTNKLQEREG